MEICKYYRREYDYSKIRYESMLNPQKGSYPKYVPAKDGSSNSFWMNPNQLFKRKLQDGNFTLNFHSGHHFRYEEQVGSFDDLAEVLSYTIAKNLGTRVKTDNNGNSFEAPVVDCAKYELATFTNAEEQVYRGCVTENIVPNGAHLIKGSDILRGIPEGTRPTNSLPDYLKAVEAFGKRMGCAVDKNIENDLIINSYFCWKIFNSDNHGSNITFLNQRSPDGGFILTVSPIIDNGSAWELSLPYANQNNPSEGCRYETIKNSESCVATTDENGKTTYTFTKEPFVKHTAFSLKAGSLGGHSKEINGEKFEYEYDLAAHALANPEVYSAIYSIESNFNLQGAFKEMGDTYRILWPDHMKDVIAGASQYKTDLISSVMADYYCYTAFTNAVGEVNQEQPSETYLMFREEMQKLPLQPNAESYMEEFLKIAEQNQVAVDQSQLENLEFLPKPENEQAFVQDDDVVQ